MIKKFKNNVSRISVVRDFDKGKAFGTFYEKKNQKEFRVEKVIKRKEQELYFKWKDYDSSFNTDIDKRDTI